MNIPTINIKLETVEVKSKSIKTKWTHIIGDPIYDIHELAAKIMGTTKDEYRKSMNTEEGYNELIEMDNEN